MQRRKWFMIGFAGLAGLALACDPEPGAKPGPHDCGDSKQQGCTPAAKNTKSDDGEGRYRIIVEGATDDRKIFGSNVFINHNARGSFMHEDVKQRLLDGEVRWTDTVRAPKSRTWQVNVSALATAPNQLLITCKIEILGGLQDGGLAGQPQVSHNGGAIVCIKPSGL